MQESAEHVPPEVLWSLKGSICLTNPWARLPSVPYPVNSGPDTTMTTCTERPDRHCATVEYTNKQCRHTQVCSLPLRRLIKPIGLVIPQASSASSFLLALDGESGRRYSLICPHTCMWFGNAARDCCPRLSNCPEPARPFPGNVLPHSLAIQLFVAHSQLLTSSQCVYCGF